MSDKVPAEIWLYISQFIPDDDIYRQLRTINSVFFHLAMTIRYQEILICWSLTSLALPRILGRLRDPFVARKVKRVIVDFIYYPKPAAARHSRLTMTTKARMILILKTWLSPAGRILPPSPFQSSEARVMKAILKCISKLPAPMAFGLTDNGFDGVFVRMPNFERRHSAWSSFGENLQSLTIRAELPTTIFQKVLALKSYFRNLTALQIIAIPASVYRTGHASSDTSLKALALLINTISPKLKKLSLTVLGFAHLPDVLGYLSKSLVLEWFKLTMVPKGTTQYDSLAGLKTFLCDGAHILHELDLDIVTAQTAYPHYLPDPILGRLLLDCAKDKRCFTHLQSLKINPTAGSIRTDILRTSIQRASNTLKNLVIYHNELSQEEVVVVMDALSKCSNLTYLRLRIVHLDFTIMDSMATNLPGLKQLDLWHGMDALPMERFTLALIQHFRNPQKPSYLEWKLEDISIYFGQWDKADVAMMNAFSCGLPSIKSFCGRGHMRKIDPGDLYRARIN